MRPAMPLEPCFPANPFLPHQRVVITLHDWQVGEVTLRGTVTRILSDTHCRVLLDGDTNQVAAVPVEDMVREPAAANVVAPTARAA